jgi:hypothetical protein
MTWNWVGSQPHVVFPFESVLRWVPTLTAGTSKPTTNSAVSAKVTVTYRW